MTATTPISKADAARGSSTSSSGPPLRQRVSRGVAWTLLIALIVITLFPFYWALRTAVTTNPDLFGGDNGLIPQNPTDLNFLRVLGQATPEEVQFASGRENSGSFDYLQALKNSVIIATAIAVGQVFFSALAAYAFSRLRFKGREKLFFLYLTGLMIPPIFTLIPNLLIIRGDFWLFQVSGESLDWLPFYESQGVFLLNTLPGVIAPFFLMTPFAVFFLRQFFLGINRSLEEAALIDGASHARIFRSVILPLATPQMLTLGVLTYVTAWNEYLWPLVVARAEEVQPMTVALGIFSSQQPGTAPDWSGLMAGTLLGALPVILIFLFFGRRLVDSIQFSGIK